MNIRVPYIIPEATSEKALLESLYLLQQLKEGSNPLILDFKGVDFLHPFLLSILGFYLKTTDESFTLINATNNINSILENFGLYSKDEFRSFLSPEFVFSFIKESDLLPLCKFECSYPHLDRMETILKTKLFAKLENFNLGYEFKGGISYLISELLDNIKEHSHASHGLIYINNQVNNTLYISIGDNGINIQGSYLLQAKPEFRILLGNNNVEAIRYSVKGLSTKNNNGSIYRGYGLSTNINMVTNGLNGDFIIISGDGLFYSNKNEERYINLPPGFGWDGTLVMIKIPLKGNPDFQYGIYLE